MAFKPYCNECLTWHTGHEGHVIWQPTPRDGTQILARGGGLGEVQEIVSYNGRIGCWDAPNDTLDDTDHEPDGYNRPSHWAAITSR